MKAEQLIINEAEQMNAKINEDGSEMVGRDDKKLLLSDATDDEIYAELERRGYELMC